MRVSPYAMHDLRKFETSGMQLPLQVSDSRVAVQAASSYGALAYRVKEGRPIHRNDIEALIAMALERNALVAAQAARHEAAIASRAP